jgi:hypothetical protein
MSYVTVEEFELLSFFGVEPKRADGNVPWPYNDFTYQVSLDEYAVEFVIHPAYKDLSFTLSRNSAELYTFTALSVDDVRYHNHPDREVLEIAISGRQSIWLRLRPTVLFAQEVKNET